MLRGLLWIQAAVRAVWLFDEVSDKYCCISADAESVNKYIYHYSIQPANRSRLRYREVDPETVATPSAVPIDVME